MAMFMKSQTSAADPYAKLPFQTVENFELNRLEKARHGRKKRRALPIKQVAYLLVAFFAFKVFLHLDMGGAAYGAKAEELAQGNQLERAASWAMQMDPITQWLVTGITLGDWT